MVIRLVAVPDFLDLTDFDDIFNAVLGWDSGIGYAFRGLGSNGTVNRLKDCADKEFVTIQLRFAAVASRHGRRPRTR